MTNYNYLMHRGKKIEKNGINNDYTMLTILRNSLYRGSLYQGLSVLSNFAQCKLPCANLNPIARILWAPSTTQNLKVTLIEWLLNMLLIWWLVFILIGALTQEPGKCKHIFSFELRYRSLIKALPSRKFFIKSSAIYVFIRICLKLSKWSGPLLKCLLNLKVF